MSGLLSGIERKTCWQLAEQAGHARPDAMQRLLRTARWDEDAVRDDLRALVVEHLGHDDGVLVVDETGFLKKGACSAGVQRQYSGTAGRIENTQIGVFLAYASPRGRALIDRRLYVPASWCDDTDRRRAAGIPDGLVFATKPRLAADMIAAALDAGLPANWETGDEVYGQDPALRGMFEARGVGYVLAVSCSTRVRINDGATPVRSDRAVAALPESAWQVHSAGPGAKGPRYYAWAWIAVDGDGSRRQLLVRRNRATGELAFYLCFSPVPVPLATVVRVAGTRWSVEECFQAAKGQVGLDHYQVRGTPPGTGTSPWPCSPWPSSRSPPPTHPARTPAWSGCPSTRSAVCSTPSSCPSGHCPRSSCTGHTGADDTRNKPDRPTTNADSTNDHEVRLEYQTAECCVSAAGSDSALPSCGEKSRYECQDEYRGYEGDVHGLEQ